MSNAQKQWVSTSSGGPVALASAGAALAVMSIATDPLTIRRIVLDVAVTVDGVAQETGTGMWGCIVQDERSVTAGIASVPLPITNGDQEWLVTRGYTVQFTANSTYLWYRVFIDGRAMRKMKQTDRLIFVIQAEVGAPVEFMFQGRVLIST